MNLKAKTAELLKKYELKAKKSLGQNFLIDESKLKAIIEAAEITENDHIIEVGPGLGALTSMLEPLCGKLTCIELDNNLVELLREAFPNIELLHMDALKCTPPETPYKVVANIPYYITSPLINLFIKEQIMDEKNPPETLIFLVQKEIADKATAKPGDLNVLALNIQTFANVEKVINVPAGCFLPAPKVDSAVIKITPHHKPTKNLKKYFQLINGAFSKKRKTLRNSLKPFNITEEMLKKAGISPMARPQELSIKQWQTLANL